MGDGAQSAPKHGPCGSGARRALTSGLAAMALALTGCGERAAEPTGSQVTVQDGAVLTNEYFAMRAEAPEGWHVLDRETLASMLQMGGEMAAEGNRELEETVHLALKQQAPLFGIFRYAPGETAEQNPNIIANAERVPTSTGVLTGADYFDESRALMAQASANFEIAEPYGTRMIGGVAFYRMDVDFSINETSAEQAYYAARRGEYIVLLIASPRGPETNAVLDGLTFDWD